MNTRLLLLSFATIASLSLGAQNATSVRTKIDLQLGRFLELPHAGDEMVDLFIHGSVTGVGDAVREQGGFVKMSMARLTSARVPVANVRALAEADAVERFEFSMDVVHELCDSMRVKAHVNEVHAGLSPLPQAYDGQDVVVGIIDTGLDHNHPDFLDDSGNTRVAWYWDQGVTGSGAPPEFGYGREWNSAAIDANIISVTDNGTHGTNVAGAAVSDGSAANKHKGVAPAADIIVVRYSGSNFRAAVADGVKYVFDRAAQMGKPAVVNASLGTYTGSHDGLDAAALFIDSLIAAERGRAMVCAGGNLNLFFPIHLRTEVDSDTSWTWFTTNTNPMGSFNPFGFNNLAFELWADMADFANVQYAIGADRLQPSVQFRGRTAFQNMAANLGNVINAPLVSVNGNTIGTVQFYAQQRGAQVQLQVFMPVDTAAYSWRLMTTGSGAFDVWSFTNVMGTSNVVGPLLASQTSHPFPTIAELPAMAHYVEPDLNEHIVDSWACSPKTLTVANYINQSIYTGYDGSTVDMGTVPYTISITSSAGPTRDLRWKPEIGAPGDITMTAGSAPTIANFIANEPFKVDPSGWHMRDGGTSMAAPVVAGGVALYLQKCPNADWQQIRQAFISTATEDALTGAVPNNRFGYGRVHVFDALASSNIPDITISASDDEMCSNEEVEVTAPTGFDAYLWSNGTTGNPSTYTGAGPLMVVASTTTGCAHSNALTFTVLPAPPTPVITVDGTELTSTAAPAYQWYVDGNMIGGATGMIWTALVSGNYTVEVTDANGCAALSAPVNVLISGIGDAVGERFAVWPSPANEMISIRVPAGVARTIVVQVNDASGRVVLSQRLPYASIIDLPIAGLSEGAYTLRVEHGDVKWETRFVKMP